MHKGEKMPEPAPEPAPEPTVEALLPYTEAGTSIPIVALDAQALPTWRDQATVLAQGWIASTGFVAKPATHCLIPGEQGAIETVLAGISTMDDPFAIAHLAKALPEGRYHLSAPSPEQPYTTTQLHRAALGFGLGAYRFNRYRQKPAATKAKLMIAPEVGSVLPELEALYRVRDLINTPAEHMMPEHLADTVMSLSQRFGATVRQWVGGELLTHNFPAIHAVGRAASHPPRLIELHWGEPTHPRLTLIGKGVCFDSGGLDIKGSRNMRLMKKDMGGAAHAIGLAQMVMSAKLPVRLRLLIPAVENAIAGNAYRPGDVLATRKGIHVEVDNTDAEGRIILCDAIYEAGCEAPELMVDFATLTGAARVALGTDMPAMFTNHDETAQALTELAGDLRDPLWRLPLFQDYRSLLDSKVADLVNSAPSPYAGAITAALFLETFVPPEVPWVHFDVMAWNVRSRPGRPEGGEGMGLRTLFAYLCQRFGSD